MTTQHCQAGIVEAARFYDDAVRRFDKGDLNGAVVQLKNSIKENESQVAAPLLLGKVLATMGDLTGAEATYVKAISQGADRSELVVPLARIYMELDQPAKALAAIGTGSVPRGARVEALALRGAAYAALGDQRLAQQSFDEARAIDPNAVSIALEEMPMLLRSGKIARAVELAAKAVALEPGNAQAWTMNAVVLRESGNANASLAAYDKAVALAPARRIDARLGRAALLFDLGRYKDAQKDIDALTKAAPDDVRVMVLRGNLARVNGDLTAAAALFKQVADILEQLPPSWFATREPFAMMAAMVHHQLGDRQKALADIQGILGVNPKHVAARVLQATVLMELGDFERARPVLESLRSSSGEDPNLLYQQGVTYLGLGRHAEAVAALEAALPRLDTPQLRRTLGQAQIALGLDDAGIGNLERAYNSAKDVEAGRALALSQVRRGLPKKALDIAQAMVKQEPGRPGALDFLGTIRGLTGDLKGAREAFTQALAAEPRFGPSLLNLTRLDMAAGDFDVARRRLEAMLSKEVVPDFLYELGLVELGAGRVEEALRHFRRLTDQSGGYRRAEVQLIDTLVFARRADQAIEAGKVFVYKAPNDFALRMALARAHLASGDANAARSELKEATSRAGFEADKQVAIGRLQLYANNPSGAAYNVQKALQGRPNDIGALALAVAVELLSGDRDAAEKALKVLTTRYPNRAETLLATAGAAMARRKFDEAVAIYTRAFAVSETSDVLLLLGRAHVSAGKPAEAARAYDNWLKKKPKDLTVRQALAEAQFQAGQLAAARENYTVAVAADPKNDAMLNNLANVMLLLGDRAAAKTTAEKALKLVPNSANYMDTLGWILFESGQAEAGLPYLRDARLRNPENAEFRLHLSFALHKLGRRDEARTELAGALKAAPGLTSVPAVAKLKTDLGL